MITKLNILREKTIYTHTIQRIPGTEDPPLIIDWCWVFIDELCYLSNFLLKISMFIKHHIFRKKSHNLRETLHVLVEFLIVYFDIKIQTFYLNIFNKYYWHRYFLRVLRLWVTENIYSSRWARSSSVERMWSILPRA